MRTRSAAAERAARRMPLLLLQALGKNGGRLFLCVAPSLRGDSRRLLLRGVQLGANSLARLFQNFLDDFVTARHGRSPTLHQILVIPAMLMTDSRDTRKASRA